MLIPIIIFYVIFFKRFNILGVTYSVQYLIIDWRGFSNLAPVFRPLALFYNTVWRLDVFGVSNPKSTVCFIQDGIFSSESRAFSVGGTLVFLQQYCDGTYKFIIRGMPMNPKSYQNLFDPVSFPGTVDSPKFQRIRTVFHQLGEIPYTMSTYFVGLREYFTLINFSICPDVEYRNWVPSSAAAIAGMYGSSSSDALV